MKRLQFIILALTMFCTSMVMANIESYANDPPGIDICVDMNFDVVAENVVDVELGVIEGVFAVYSCDLTLWPEVSYSVTISKNSAIINNFTRIGVLNKGSTIETFLYAYTLRIIDLNDLHTINDHRMPMKASGGNPECLFLRI